MAVSSLAACDGNANLDADVQSHGTASEACRRPPPPPPRKCNGAAELCDRPYNQVAFPTTHNGMSAEAEGWIHSDQRYGIERQLADGIRGLMLDVWNYNGQPYLCHGGACATGHRPLVDGLQGIADFMYSNPNEVVTIIFEPYVDPAWVKDALDQVGLSALEHVQPLGQPWPTLGQLIDRGERLVVFTEHNGGAFPFYQDIFAYAWDTNWEFYTPEEMNCNPNRGNVANDLFIFNNILVTDDEAEAFARRINARDFLLPRALQCQAASGKKANFVTVDYYDVGDLFSVVRELNGLTP